MIEEPVGIIPIVVLHPLSQSMFLRQIQPLPGYGLLVHLHAQQAGQVHETKTHVKRLQKTSNL